MQIPVERYIHSKISGTGKYVIYRGEDAELKDVAEDAAGNVTYLSVEEYLKKL